MTWRMRAFPLNKRGKVWYGMQEMESRCILVAEDEEAIRQVLADTLADAGYAVLTACDGRQALDLLLRERVDLALLDVNMPEITGFQLLRMMSKECPGVPSIILTAHGEERERVKGLELGADDYVVKPFSIAELLARIAAVLRRVPARRVAPADGISFPGGQLDSETREVIPHHGERVPLTEKEYELFRYFLMHPGRVISQEELLLRVWGSDRAAGRTRTVAVTLTRLRDKLPKAAAAAFENIRGRGYRWNDTP